MEEGGDGGGDYARRSCVFGIVLNVLSGLVHAEAEC